MPVALLVQALDDSGPCHAHRTRAELYGVLSDRLLAACSMPVLVEFGGFQQLTVGFQALPDRQRELGCVGMCLLDSILWQVAGCRKVVRSQPVWLTYWLAGFKLWFIGWLIGFLDPGLHMEDPLATSFAGRYEG